MRKFNVLIFALIFPILETSGQSRWIQQYLESLNVAGNYMAISYDNGYLLTGSIIPNYQFTWLIKTDINGEILWEKRICGYFNRIKTDRIDKNQVGEIFLGGSVVLDGNTDAMIMKLNACGEKEWCRILSTTSNNDFFMDLVGTPDRGCAGLVFGAFYPLFEYRSGIVRFTSNGDLLWQQYYQSQDPGIDNENLSNLLLTPDSGFLMTGYCYYPDPGNPGLSWLHPYYVKTDSLGNFEWEVVLHSETADIGGKGRQTILNPLGTYYYSCINHYYHSDTLYAKRPALVKMDLQGNVLGVYDIVQDDYDWGGMLSISFINDSLLAGGAGWGYDGENPISRAIVMDTLGQIKDSITLLSTGWLAKTSVTHDGKLLFYNTIEEDDGFDTYLFKLTQDLEQDTFYTRPFVYDSLCPYQIVSDTIVPDDCGVIVGVEAGGQGGMEAGKQGGLEVWPNPCREILNCKFSILNSGRGLYLSVYDVFGREIDGIKVPERQDQVQINVENYPPGVYIAVLKNGCDFLGSGKFVVAR